MIPCLRTLSLLAVAMLPAPAFAADPGPLRGTAPLTLNGDLSMLMHEAADRDMDRRMAAAQNQRAQFWHRDTSSPVGYEKSVAENRERLKRIIGLADERVAVRMERFGDELEPAEMKGGLGDAQNPSLVAEAETHRVFQVRWTVLKGVTAEGLLLEPRTPTRGYVIALPDADQTPEQIAGLARGVDDELRFARNIATLGFTVLVPALIDRSTAGSGHAEITITNQPHREWLHRQAYMMGRHIIGYEVQKVLAAVDWIERRGGSAASRIGVIGYGEGGLIAFYAAAVDPRIPLVCVSGYFRSREQTWSEPLYRNVWGLLREFGDAEIASLIAPRTLFAEYSREPDIAGPPPLSAQQKKCAAPGALITPAAAEVRAEWKRIDTHLPHTLQARIYAANDQPLEPFHEPDLVRAFASQVDEQRTPMERGPFPSRPLEVDLRRGFDPAARQLRQVREIEHHVQHLVQISDHTRDDFFLYKVAPEYRNEKWTYAHFEPKPPEPFIADAKPYRDLFWRETLGKIDEPLPPPNPRTRKVYDTPKFTGHEVVLDTGGETFTWGVLLLPKDLKPDEKRPVVVCQHGRRGTPADVIEARKEAYHDFAARLAEQGFIVLAPHNLYGQEPLYRQISRKGNTIGLSMFSMILRHHQQWLAWLGSLPNVDAQRIGFYGLSYGGESAVRIPPLLEGYALSICSGDFNDWTRKVASTDGRHSFMYSDEWEMPYFNMGNTFSYAELTYLMFPRPFMVERGHHDGVAPDHWVASEYAKTRFLYDQYGLGDRTAIEFFNGGHTINAQGAFDFLHQHLNWPKR